MDLSTLLDFGTQAATGGLAGAALRLLPAFFSGVARMWTASGDRAHEIEMRKLDMQVAKEGGEQRLREIDQAGHWEEAGKTLDIWREAIAAQGRPTGNAFADAASALVRPIVTYYFMVMYAGVKVCVAVWPGQVDVWTALWTPADSQMFFGILGFWFVDRQLGKSAVAK